MANDKIDDWQDVEVDDWKDVPVDRASAAADFLEKKVGPAIGSTIGRVSETVGKYTSAPIKAGIDNALKEGNALDVLNPLNPHALKNFGEGFAGQFGNPTSESPKFSDMAKRYGVPVEAGFNLPLKKDLEGGKYRVTAGDAIDVVGDSAIDPTTYAGGGFAKGVTKAGMSAASGMAEKVGSEKLAAYLAKKAEERAVKASTGQNVRALRDLAGVSSRSAGDLAKAEGSLQRAGRDILDSGQLGYFDRTESLAPKLNAEKTRYGQKIGEIGSAIDEAAPNAVSSQNIAQQITAYADSLPDTPAGVKLKERLYDQAAGYEKMPGMSFKDAQFEKNQFKYRPGEADSLVSNQDVSNRIQSIISKEMENTTDELGKRPELAGQLGEYKDAKSKYRTFKLTGDAATDRSVKNMSNRFVSPSDYGMGGAGAVLGGLATGGAGIPAMAAGAGAAAANKLLRERGSAFAARSLDAMSNGLKAAPATIGKYAPILERAAQEGGRSLAVTHHLLLKNDPEYIKTMDGLLQ